MRSVAKKSADKVSVGGRKTAFREYTDTGHVVREAYALDATTIPGQPLQVPVIRAGEIVHRPTLGEIRAFTAQRIATLPDEAANVSAGPPHLTVTADSEAASP